VKLLNCTTLAVAAGCLGVGIYLGDSGQNVSSAIASAFLVATSLTLAAAVALGATK
jgi:hypothetical protein